MHYESHKSSVNVPERMKAGIRELKCNLETQGDDLLDNMAALIDIILRLAVNIDILTTEMKQVKNEIKDLNKEYDQIYWLKIRK